MDNVTVILTPLDAEQFKTFQKYHDVLSVLVKTPQLLDILTGKIVMNFVGGELQNVVKEEIKYRR